MNPRIVLTPRPRLHGPLALCLTLVFAGTASAAPLGRPVTALWQGGVDGDKVLAEIDRRADPFTDQHYLATMEIIKNGELKRTLSFSSTMKGVEKQLIEFTAPGDVAGMKVLMLDADTLYLFSKEFGKVRKVAAHTVKQGFMGSEFTFEDMTQIKLAPFFDAKIQGKQGDLTTLVLTPKQGVETAYPRLEIVIDGKKGGVTVVRYFDSTGAQVREQQRDAWQTFEGHAIPTRVTMANLKTGDRSVITMTDVTVNRGVDESVFSRRQLLRG